MLVRFTTIDDKTGQIKKRWKDLPTKEAAEARKKEHENVKKILAKKKGNLDGKESSTNYSEELAAIREERELLNKAREEFKEEMAAFREELKETKSEAGIDV